MNLEPLEKDIIYDVKHQKTNFWCIGLYKGKKINHSFETVHDKNHSWGKNTFSVHDENISDFKIKKIGTKEEHPEYYL